MNFSRRAVGSRFLGGAHQHFADEGLRLLGDDGGDDRGDVVGLEHLVGILAGVAITEVRVDGAGGDDADADVVLAELFGDGGGEAVESPLGGSVRGVVGERIAAGQRRDVDDVAGAGGDHHRREGADH